MAQRVGVESINLKSFQSNLFNFQLVLPAGGRLVRAKGQEIWGCQWKGTTADSDHCDDQNNCDDDH